MRRIMILVAVLAPLCLACADGARLSAEDKPAESKASDAETARIEALIAELRDDHPFVHTNAFYQIILYGEKAKPLLRAAIAREGYLAKDRARKALEACDDPTGAYCQWWNLSQGGWLPPDERKCLPEFNQKCFANFDHTAYMKSLGEKLLKFADEVFANPKPDAADLRLANIIYPDFYDEKIEAKLIQALDAEVEGKKEVALIILNGVGTRKGIEAIIAKCKKSERDECLKIVRDYLWCSAPATVEYLTELSRSEDKEVALTALYRLAKQQSCVSRPNTELAKKAITLLDKEDLRTVRKVCDIVTLTRASDCCEALMPLLDGKDTVVEAAHTLAQCGYAPATQKILSLYKTAGECWQAKTNYAHCLLRLGHGFKDKAFAKEAKKLLYDSAAYVIPRKKGVAKKPAINWQEARLGSTSAEMLLAYYGSDAAAEFAELARLSRTKNVAGDGARCLRMLRDKQTLVVLRKELQDARKDLIYGESRLFCPLIIVADEGALPMVQKGLESEWPDERAWAVNAAYAFGDDSLRDEVLGLLRGNSVNARYWAMQSLAARNDSTGIGLMIQAINENCNDYVSHYQSGIEWITGHTVGYSNYAGWESRSAAVKRWQDWWAKNKGKSIEQMRLGVYEGRGYKVKSFTDPASLPELIRALNDDTWQLRRLTGIMLSQHLGFAVPGQMGCDEPESVRKHAVKLLTDWYATNKDKLKWSKDEERFVVAE